MSQRLLHSTLTSTFVLVTLAASCGVTSGAPDVQTATLVQALEVADFTIGTDTPIPEQYDAGNYPSVAAAGSQRLVVFEDGGRIRGVRFDDAGVVLDLSWLDFGIAERTQVYPAVAFGADRYLVVWSEFGENDSTIYAQTVTIDGQLQGEPQPVAAGYDAQVCWLGESFVIVYSDNGLHLAQVDTNGALIADSSVLVSADDVTATTRPAIAANETLGVVAFSEDDGTRRNVRVARFDAQGQILDPGGVVVNPAIQGTSELALAVTNEHSLVTFKDEANLIYGSLLSSDGALEVTEFPIVSSGDITGHAAGTDGTTFKVIWETFADEQHELHGVTVEADGSVDSNTSSLEGESNAFQAMAMDVTFSNGTYALVYEGIGVLGEQFSPDFEPSTPVLNLSALPNAQNIPFAAWDGSQYIVSYNDERGESFQARAVRVSKAGRVVDPEGILLSPADRQAFTSASASNAFGTSAFVFTTLEESNAYLRTMNSDAQLSDTVLLAEGNPQGVDVVSNGTTFLVGYQLGPETTSQTLTHYVQPLNETGELVGEPVAVLPDFSRPRVIMTTQGQDFLVAYSGQTQDTGAAIDGKLIRISASGEKLAELQAPSAGNPFYTSASNPDGTVVFGWNDYETQEVWVRILAGDTWGDSQLLTAQPSEEAPAFGWDGTKFVSLWVERRTALWTRDVNVDGTLGEESVAVSGDHTWPKLTMGPGPEMLLTSVHWELFSRTRRIESRFVGANGTTLPTNPIQLDAMGNTSDTDVSTNAPEESSPTTVTTSDEGADPAPSGGLGTSTAPSSTATPSTAPTSATPDATSDTTPTSSPTTQADETKESTQQNSKKSSGGCSVVSDSSRHSLPAWVFASLFGLLLTRRKAGALRP